ncbi:MAG TPA: T9SS type A sorting domain-containing protein [Bacteroidales bacterium]
MLKKILLLLCNGFLLTTACFEQSPVSSPVLLASGGEFFKIADSYSLSYSIGEMAVKTLSKGNHILTEGFQQGKPHFPVPVIKDILCMPNPVEEKLTIAFYVDNGLSFVIKIYNILGKAIDSYEYDNVLSGDMKYLNFSKYAKGFYLIQVISKNGNVQRTFKIEKI